jgi:predicted Rossmann-fold nucleotide-binding protein
LDEFFEMLTWNQLSIHDKKIFVLNSSGFYDHLIAHMKKLEDEKFLYDTVLERMTIINKPEELEF